MKLEGQVALVTGGAQGIGEAISRALAEEGATVIISDINLEGATETASRFNKEGKKAIPLRMNVAVSAEVKEKIDAVLPQVQKIDILVNNAGITRDALLFRMKDEDWELVLRVNLTGAYNCMKAISPLMMKIRYGRMVNIASIVGQMGNLGQANYVASKAGLIGLTKVGARELAPRGITVNAIAPGFIDTDMTRKLPEEVKEKLKAQIPLERLGTPEDVAHAVLFLASPQAGYITGHVLAVNGGMLMA